MFSQQKDGTSVTQSISTTFGKSRFWLATLAGCLLMATSMPALPEDGFKVEIERAKYRKKIQRLNVKVNFGIRGKRVVRLLHGTSGEILLRKTSRHKVTKLRLEGVTGSDVPCVVKVRSNGMSNMIIVNNAPDDCGVQPPPDENQ